MGLKFHNQPTEVDGLKFASKKEARRYGELRLLERAGEIIGLDVHPAFPLKVNNQLVCTYLADFTYMTAPIVGKPTPGLRVVEDVKSPITRKHPVYRIKAKLFKAIHGFDVAEV